MREAPHVAARLAVAGLACSALMVVAGTAPSFAQPTPAPAPTVPPVVLPTAQGVPSSQAGKLAEAKRLKRRVEVPELAERASTTFANPDGTLTEEITQAPTRVKAADGSLAVIDPSLTASKGRLVSKVTTSRVSFRANATADAGKADVAELDLPGEPVIAMGFGAVLPAPVVVDDTATYRLSATSSLQTTALDDGFVADVVLTAAPAVAPTYRFPLDTAGGLTPKLEAGVVHFVNAAGTVVAGTRPLVMWDAHRDAAGDPDHLSELHPTLTDTGTGWELALTPSMAYLTDPATQYPVVVDPTVTTTDTTDASYYPGNSTDYLAEPWIRVGPYNSHSWRTWFRWNTGPFTGRAITSAKMQLFEYSAGSCSPKATLAYPTTTDRSDNANNVSVDKDAAWADSATFNTGGDSCSGQPNGYQDFEVTKVIEAFTTGELPHFGMGDTTFFWVLLFFMTGVSLGMLVFFRMRRWI